MYVYVFSHLFIYSAFSNIVHGRYEFLEVFYLKTLQQDNEVFNILSLEQYIFRMPGVYLKN